MIESNLPEQTLAPQPIINKPKPWLPIALVIVIVALVSGGSVYLWQQNEIKKLQSSQPRQIDYVSNRETPSAIPTSVPTQSKISSLDPIDNIWNLYTNSKSGFSMKLPKVVASGLHNNCPDISSVPVVVFDDSTGAYITVEYFYEYSVNNICQKTTNSLSTIDQRVNQWKSGQGNNLFVPSNWHIVVAKVENDSELEQFIKASWGTGCKLGAKTKTANGTYDVRVTGDGLDLEATKCPINFALAFKYSPEFKKAATWAMGQDITFSFAEYKQTYDEEIVNSFKFIN